MFQIQSDGTLSFKIAPDHETPQDTGGTANDNVYEIEVHVSDGFSTDTDTIQVTVSNVPFDETLVYTVATGNGADEITLRRNEGNLEVFDVKADSVAVTASLEELGQVVISGAAQEDDTVTIDFSLGGFFPCPGA